MDEPALSEQLVGSDRLVILVPPTHPWASKRKLHAEDFFGLPWVLRETCSGTRSSLEVALRAAGVDPTSLLVTMTLPSNEAVLAAAEAGAGATALSESVALSAIIAGRLTSASFPLGERRYRLVRHKERYRSRAGEAFVAAIC